MVNERDEAVGNDQVSIGVSISKALTLTLEINLHIHSTLSSLKLF